jgi:hypothetical protein
MKNNSDPPLLQTSYISNEIKKDTKISWDYPFNISVVEPEPQRLLLLLFFKNGTNLCSFLLFPFTSQILYYTVESKVV